MLTISTFSLLHEKNNFASQFFAVISYYRFIYEIIGKKYWYICKHNFVTTNHNRNTKYLEFVAQNVVEGVKENINRISVK